MRTLAIVIESLGCKASMARVSARKASPSRKKDKHPPSSPACSRPRQTRRSRARASGPSCRAGRRAPPGSGILPRRDKTGQGRQSSAESSEILTIRCKELLENRDVWQQLGQKLLDVLERARWLD